MPTDFSKLEMGPCTATFNASDLGLTKGGVEVEFATEVSDITADQFGDSVINQVIKGRMVKAKVPLAENDLDRFATVFPGVTLVDDVANSIKKLVFNTAVGTSLRDNAAELILHPQHLDAADKSRDVTIPLAMAKGDMQFAFKVDEQRVYTLEFVGYPDLDTDVLFILGDPAAVAA